MKGPHAAALAAGWLAVALSMAALATAAISRVGTETSGAQAQITITMTAPAKATTAPTNAPSNVLQIPGAPTTAGDPSVTPSPWGATSVQVKAALSVRSVTVRTTQPSTPSTAPAAVSTSPVAVVPNVGRVPQPANTATATKTPTPTKSTSTTKTPTPSASTSTRTPISGSNSGELEQTWSHHQGGIHAGCRGDNLAYAEPWAAKGYKIVKQASWFCTAISFKGSTPVTVMVGCHAGHPSFTTSG